MGTIYQFNQVYKLEFEIDSTSVLLNCELLQGTIRQNYNFVITHTELNRLLGSIQFYNKELDIQNALITEFTDEDTKILSFDFQNNKLNSQWLNDYNFTQKYKEIRA